MPTASEQFRNLLAASRDCQASDLHLAADDVAYARVHGDLRPLDDNIISADQLDAMLSSLMEPEQWCELQQHHTIDLAYSHDGNRFRINVFRQRGKLAMAIRRLDNAFRTLDELHLPEQLKDLVHLQHGLALVTGATGSGKTTTLATLLHEINCTRPCHIITIEDPIEYVHENRTALVHQRELHSDVPSFADAVRASLREDPDVILVGEMRDLETMRAAITAAETGHLVFSTLHTGDTVGALDRMLGAFPAEEQSSVRHQVSMVLQAVVAQQLLPSACGEIRVPAVEILRVTTAVGNQIRSGKFEQIYATIEGGLSLGMQTMEHSLAELATRGLIDTDVAIQAARNPLMVESRLKSNIADEKGGRSNLPRRSEGCFAQIGPDPFFTTKD
ncbi:MAG: twitching motility protein [Phycisphaerae bacterium]|nr:twitching motility protein [Phycisphaerae bacterium]